MAREDGPLTSLLDRQLMEITGEASPEQILDDILDPDEPLNWGYQGGNGIGRNLPAARIDRNFTASATIIDNVLGVNYGAEGRRIAGLCGLVYRTQFPNRVFVAYFFSEGELPTGAYTEIEVNNEDIATVNWVIQYEEHLGADTQAISTILNGAMASVGLVETYPGMAYIVLELNANSADCPNALTVTAKTKGRKIFDYRTSTWAESSNIALIQYDILTFDEVWLNKQASQIDTGVASTWNDAADHFDTVMADTTLRYSFDGLVVERDPERALQLVGRHAFSEVHYRHDKFILKTLANRTPASTYIEAGDWIQITKGREVPIQTIPNIVNVNYPIEDTFSKGSEVVEDPAGVGSGDYRPVEENLPGCYSRSHARRWAEKYYNHGVQERLQWNGRLPEAIVADVIPGDVIQAKFPEFEDSYIAVRVESITESDNGQVDISLTQYGATTDSTSTATDDSTADQGTLTDTSAPDAPTACDQIFGESGPWGDRSLIPHPSDLQASQGWTWRYNQPSSVVYVGGPPDYTEISDSGTPFVWDWYHTIDPGDADYALITFCYRIVNKDISEAAVMAASYQSDTVAPASSTTPNTNWFRHILWVDEDVWIRMVALVPVHQTDTYHWMRFAAGKNFSSSTMELEIRRLHIVPLTSLTDLRRELFDLYERWTWTEHASAEDTVAFYQAIRGVAQYQQIVAAVPQGETELEFHVASQSPSTTGVPIGGRAASTSPPSIKTELTTLGLNGQYALFPDPTTQTWELDSGLTQSPDVPLTRAKATGTARYHLCTLADKGYCSVDLKAFLPTTGVDHGDARIQIWNDSGVVGYDWHLVGDLEDVAWIEAYDTGTEIEVWLVEAVNAIKRLANGFQATAAGILSPLNAPLSSASPSGSLVFDASDVLTYPPRNMGWVDEVVWPTATIRGGSKDPDFDKYRDDGAGSQGVFAYHFDTINEEELYHPYVLPDGWRAGSTIYPVIKWSVDASQASSYSVKWDIEVTIANEGAAFPTTSFYSGTDTDTFSTAFENRRLTLASISGSGITPRANFEVRPHRDPSVAGDLPADAVLHSVIFRVFLEKIGGLL